MSNVDRAAWTRRLILLGVPAAMLSYRLGRAVADERPAEPTEEPAAPKRELATFALG